MENDGRRKVMSIPAEVSRKEEKVLDSRKPQEVPEANKAQRSVTGSKAHRKSKLLESQRSRMRKWMETGQNKPS